MALQMGPWLHFFPGQIEATSLEFFHLLIVLQLSLQRAANSLGFRVVMWTSRLNVQILVSKCPGVVQFIAGVFQGYNVI